MRAARPLALLLIAASLAGCVGMQAAPLFAPRVIPASLAAPADDAPYTLDSGDKLRVTVFGQDGITNTYIVDASGHVTLPLIGSVAARGLTNRGLAAAIAERLRAGFIREPHVAIEIQSYRPFFILGEVTAPGQYPFVPNMTAETAVAIAGGFTARASRSTIYLSRTADGVMVRAAVPVTTPVRPGDTITIAERWF